MKKRLAAVLIAATMTIGMTTTVFAAVSPTSKPTTKTSTKSPKTGESDALIYGLAATLLATGTAVVSKKKLSQA